MSVDYGVLFTILDGVLYGQKSTDPALTRIGLNIVRPLPAASRHQPLGRKPMKIKRITIDPDPYESFRLAQGYRVGDLLFISGQAAIDGSGHLVGVGNFDTQATQVFANLERVLHAGGSSLANVVKVTIFLRDMSNFQKIVDLRGRYFTPPYPADTIVEVSSLYSPDALIEIEAIAVVDEAVEK